MWGTLLIGLFARPMAWHLTVYALTTFTITLFIFNLRRTSQNKNTT
jgi:hypothetical protein